MKFNNDKRDITGLDGEKKPRVAIQNFSSLLAIAPTLAVKVDLVVQLLHVCLEQRKREVKLHK